jgi:large subunit ribosomal protein L16
MIVPKKRKYRKAHVGVRRGLATAGSTLAFGDYGLKVLEGEDLTVDQINSARVAARKATKRSGQIIIRVQADLPKSKKPLEVRMGSGKGPVDHYAARVKPGRIIFEFVGVSAEVAMDACARAAHKLPVRAAFVSRVPVVE